MVIRGQMMILMMPFQREKLLGMAELLFPTPGEEKEEKEEEEEEGVRRWSSRRGVCAYRICGVPVCLENACMGGKVVQSTFQQCSAVPTCHPPPSPHCSAPINFSLHAALSICKDS